MKKKERDYVKIKTMYLFLLKCIFIVTFLCNISSVFANNIQISSQELVEQDMFNSYYIMVKFDITMDNSWRVSSAPNNYDGVWIFVKYKRISDGKWYHATLNALSENHYTGSQASNATIQVANNGKGVMFYRSSDGTGNFSSSNVKLRWEYGLDNIGNFLPAEISEVKIYGIEMVYVPEGAFYVGSGGSESNHFYSYGGNEAYQISSENEIIVEQNNGNLWATGEIETSIIPLAFPKGFSSFWCMKYEITQEQYVDFLNTLTRSQQNTRTATDINGTIITNRYVMSNTPNLLYRNGIRCNTALPSAPEPVTFYCDLNANGIYNELDDGQNIACNFLSWADCAAYSDWAGLKPMTELEFEKACRGPVYPVQNENAWGTTALISGTAISNSGTLTEITTPANANCITGNCINGPARVGNFARENSTRVSSGSSYYGILELSGNVTERCITIRNTTGRCFTGLLGDGTLNEFGEANVENWPQLDAFGSCFRGSHWGEPPMYARTSDRFRAGNTNSQRSWWYGFRAIVNFE